MDKICVEIIVILCYTEKTKQLWIKIFKNFLVMRR